MCRPLYGEHTFTWGSNSSADDTIPDGCSCVCGAILYRRISDKAGAFEPNNSDVLELIEEVRELRKTNLFLRESLENCKAGWKQTINGSNKRDY